MNEHEFRTALRAGMSVTPEPPPMAEGPVLDRAHRDRGRRRAVWAGTGSAAAVVAIVAGVLFLVPSAGEEGPRVAGPRGTTTEPSTTRTDLAWPNGQTDNVATSGPEYDKAVVLLEGLIGMLPAGYEVPADLVGRGDLEGVRLKRQAAQNDGSWAYHGQAPVTRDGGVGQLDLLVFPNVSGLEANEGCELGQQPECTEKLVDGKRVALFETANGQAVAYRGEHAYVSIDQATVFADAGLPELDELPFTADELAAVVTDPRFQLH